MVAPIESAAGMKIAVCAKVVPEQARRIDPETKRLDRSGEPALNPFDTHAVEEALQLKGDDAGNEVVLFSLGPERAGDALRKALAMGADRVVLVSDEGVAGSDLVATSRLLAAALARENPDLVVFGQQASDSDGAVLWAAVAERLRRPLVSQAAEETLQAVDLGLDAAEVGEAGSQTEVYELADPPARGAARKIEDDGNGAEQIVEF